MNFFCLLIVAPVLTAQPIDPEPANLQLDLKEASWFTDEISTALIFVDSEEEPTVEEILGNDEIRFLDTEVIPLENDDRGSYVVSITFIPQRTGVRTFPSIGIKLGETSLETLPRQILVGEPHTTESVSFSIQPEKTRVYASEPLRIDFVWRCDLPMNQIREFQLYPKFFNDSSIEVVIPRSDAPEDEQFGLPIGGRRAIARRIANENAFPPNLGELRFSVFVRFKEAGRYEIAPTRLLFSRLLVENAQSNRYAAYFNNALFERVDRSLPHEKLHAYSEPIVIETLPLPSRGKRESFSGLFQVDSIEVGLRPQTVEVGQLMEIRIDVNSDTCSEMLQIPDLSRQSALRSRFWVGQEINELWKSDGRTFVARARPLSVETTAFPSLSFQVFDSAAGDYREIRTAPIPLEVSVRDGMSYFPVENIPGAQYSVVGNAEGIWHNHEATIMSDVMNILVSGLAEGVWVFLFLGPIVFYVGSCWAREARKRALDASYRKRREAYYAFKQAVSKGEDGVEALRLLISGCFERENSALTARDVARLLEAAKGDRDLVEEIETTIGEVDTNRYNPNLEESKSRIRTGKLGERVFRLFQQGMVSLFLVAALLAGEDVSAADWSRAEALYSEALSATEKGEDSSISENRFAEAALEYEGCAAEGIRPGLSWYNAGNAWFKAGEIGRAVASYRQAQIYKPFDEKIAASLEAVRALRIDAFADRKATLEIPTRWVVAAFSLFWVAAFVMAIFWIRYRSTSWKAATCTGFALAFILGGVWGWRSISGEAPGVVIVDEVYGRKGPSYSYLSAFMDPLHNGLEVSVLESRGNWLLTRLQDGTDCWLPSETVQVLAE